MRNPDQLGNHKPRRSETAPAAAGRYGLLAYAVPHTEDILGGQIKAMRSSMDYANEYDAVSVISDPAAVEGGINVSETQESVRQQPPVEGIHRLGQEALRDAQ